MIHKYYLVKKSFKIPATLYQPIDDMCPGHGEFSINESVSYKKGDSIFLTAGSGEYSVEGVCDALITTIRE